jgi:amidase
LLGRPVEAVISPVTPYAGILPGKFQYSRETLPSLPTAPQRWKLTTIAYSSSLNVLDFPSVVIPVTFANKAVDKVARDYTPLTEKDRTNMALCIPFSLLLHLHSTHFHSADTSADDPEAHDGAPAAVQIFGRRWDEERLLSMAQLVADALEKYTQKHGGKL